MRKIKADTDAYFDFEVRLRQLINECSVENESDTPDYILAHFLVGCLAAFESAVKSREAWYGRAVGVEHLAVKARSHQKKGRTVKR